MNDPIDYRAMFAIEQNEFRRDVSAKRAPSVKPAEPRRAA